MLDPIADLLTRIRNAGLANHEATRAPYSKMKHKVLELIKEEGYIKKTKVSKPGCRVYRRCKDIPKVKNGLGVSIVSTSKGVVTDREARRLNIGGEVICELW